jgi:ubiquinone/menaquinone biosynthesis C-methylase UbiE
MGRSISFDRAADFYDATRAESEPVAAAITESLLDEIREAGEGPVLEIGIGTGRISRPLMEHGVPIAGIDISQRMMSRLLAQLPPVQRAPDLLLADATCLPFDDNSFGCVLAVHVLHLVSSLPKAIAEVARVLRSGGVLLHQTHTESGVHAATTARFDELLRERGVERQKGPRYEEIREALTTSGATSRTRNICEEEQQLDPAEVLREIRDRVHSWTWRVPEDAFRACIPEFEEYFRTRYASAPIIESVTYEVEIWTWGRPSD